MHIRTHLKPFARLLPLLVVVLGLVGYNFMSAQWAPPTDTPPAGNVAAPINTGTSTQTKFGPLNIGGNLAVATSTISTIFAATNQMWSDQYCDVLGGNCFEPAEVGAFSQMLLPVQTSRYGENQRCAGDRWISACIIAPSFAPSAWTNNICVSRANADQYDWRVDWNSVTRGYELQPDPSQTTGYPNGTDLDLVCDTQTPPPSTRTCQVRFVSTIAGVTSTSTVTMRGNGGAQTNMVVVYSRGGWPVGDTAPYAFNRHVDLYGATPLAYREWDTNSRGWTGVLDEPATFYATQYINADDPAPWREFIPLTLSVNATANFTLPGSPSPANDIVLNARVMSCT